MSAAGAIVLAGDDRGTLGKRNEVKVARVLRRFDRPWWIERVRAATQLEDHAGIDVVVETSEGELHLQVKSSRNGAKLWRATRRKKGLPVDTIGIVVVLRSDCDEAIYGKALGALILLRERSVDGSDLGK